jgi:hypothetical protein
MPAIVVNIGPIKSAGIFLNSLRQKACCFQNNPHFLLFLDKKDSNCRKEMIFNSKNYFFLYTPVSFVV